MKPWRLWRGHYEKRRRGKLPPGELHDGMRPDEWPNSYVPLGLYEAFEILFFTKRK